jgi:integrase
MSWSLMITRWTLALRAGGRSERTIGLYRHYMNLAGDRLDAAPADVAAADLEQLLGATDWGPSARKSLRTALVGFYRWAAARELVPVDVAKDLPSVRVPRGRPRPTPEWVLAGALAAADERCRLMLELGALAGLRAGEIARVHRDDFDGEQLLVHGKGGKERLVPIVDGHLRRALAAADGWLFDNRLGGHLTSNHVTKLLSQLLPAPWTAHTLRHRFGCRAYASTRDLLAVSQLLGHASTETTLTYVLLPDDHLRAAVRGAAAIAA